MQDNQHDDFYHRLRFRVNRWAQSRQGRRSQWAEYLLLAPDFFHLLCKLSVDPGVSKPAKAKLVLAILYFITPVDLMPEAVMGVLGFSDDLALAVYVLNNLLQDNRAALQRHWAGQGDVLQQMEKVLAVAGKMTGTGLWQKIRKLGRR